MPLHTSNWASAVSAPARRMSETGGRSSDEVGRRTRSRYRGRRVRASAARATRSRRIILPADAKTAAAADAVGGAGSYRRGRPKSPRKESQMHRTTQTIRRSRGARAARALALVVAGALPLVWSIAAVVAFVGGDGGGEHRFHDLTGVGVVLGVLWLGAVLGLARRG